MSSSHRLAYFPGNCALFNLKAVVRLKGNDLAVAAERWDNHEDYPLVVRLFFEESGAAWMLGHWGYKEIFRSPMFLPAYINALSTTTVHVALRQWTRRKGDPINRQFCLSFGCPGLVHGFVFTHNRFIIEGKEQKAKIEDAAGHQNEDSDSNDKDLDGRSKDSDSDGGSDDGEDQSSGSDDHGEWPGEASVWFAETQNTQDPFADYISD